MAGKIKTKSVGKTAAKEAKAKTAGAKSAAAKKKKVATSKMGKTKTVAKTTASKSAQRVKAPIAAQPKKASKKPVAPVFVADGRPKPIPAPVKSEIRAALKPAPKSVVPPAHRAAVDRPAALPGAAAHAAAADAHRKKPTQRHGFRTNEYVVYPSHGVGRIMSIEEQVVAGHSLELFVINFEHEKMTLRVPTSKLEAVGMRKLAEDGIVRRALDTLRGRARIKRTMWSRRAQEYEAKINSGDLVSISEVVRDLYRAESQPEQSYSERQLFEAALDRMSREIAAIENLDERGAVQKITDILAKSARGRRVAEAAADVAQAPAARDQAA